MLLQSYVHTFYRHARKETYLEETLENNSRVATDLKKILTF